MLCPLFQFVQSAASMMNDEESRIIARRRHLCIAVFIVNVCAFPEVKQRKSLCGCATEMVFRERAPVSAFVLLPHERDPSAVFGIEGEGILKFAVRVIKSDCESISIALAGTEGL